MNVIILYIIILYLIISIISIVIRIKQEFISPSTLFLLSQLIMFSGILFQANLTYEADQILLILYFLALIMFIFGTKFARKLSAGKIYCREYTEMYKPEKIQIQIIFLIVIVSIFACIYLFWNMGGNIFLNVLSSLIGKEEAINVTESRLASYGIVGIGYIYQFRVILLPVLSLFLVRYYKKNIMTFFIFGLMICFLLGTGQRGGFVTFGIIWITVIGRENIMKKKGVGKETLLVVGFVLLLFGIMTVANGRITEDNKNVFGAMLDRFTNDNQLTAVVGFRYIYSQPIQWGKDWLSMIMDILPGKNDYLPVANRVFSIIYGSTRGTAPPCIWGSVYYNWGLIGMIVVPFLLGIFYRILYCRLFRRVVNPLRLTIYSAIFVAVGMWVADSPVVLFNQGFVTLCILAYLLHIDNPKKLKIT